MNIDKIKKMGEYFMAGHIACESPEAIIKYAWGIREFFCNCDLLIDRSYNFAPKDSFRKDMCYIPHFNGMIIFAEWQFRKYKENDKEKCEIINQLQEYWKDYEVQRAVLESISDEERKLNTINHGQGFFTDWQGHATIDFPHLVEVGFVDYKKRVLEKKSRLSSSDTKTQLFCEALLIVLEGIEELIKRNIAECNKLLSSSHGDDLFRMQRLEETFQQMLLGPPRNFFESLQFTHFFNAIDGFDDIGRLDQYLWPFYKADKEKNIISASEAELLFTELFTIFGRNTHWQVVIGGLTSDGKDASNELTMIIMNARHHINFPNPNLSLRVSEKTPDKFLLKACELLGDGVAHPALYNEEKYTSGLEDIGIPHNDACEFTLGGCTETHIAGKGAIRDAITNGLTAIEMALYNGHLKDGTAFGRKTGDPSKFKTFEAFLEAYKCQMEYIIDTCVLYRNKTQEKTASLQPALIRSLFIEDCIDKGLSHSEGGAMYNYGMIDIYGVPNIINSLFAIKTLVFDQQLISMQDLIAALHVNFQGYENIRSLCLEQHKYGNDYDDVDIMAKEISAHTFGYLQQHKLWNGGIYYGFCATAPGAHMYLGESTGATPDGRLAGTPLGNSMGAVQGTDTHGPLSMFNSVTKIDLSTIIGTPVVNVSFSKKMFDLENRARMCALIRTYFKRGGLQLQLSVVDKDTLYEAMEYPEKHKDIFVRVSGFCARFIDLEHKFQKEIISRTIH
ncbi:MAG: hypothetical protein KOO69_08215 [Victivallales bacterium]|nr:hypothetical protein [Victivallales bacterium]